MLKPIATCRVIVALSAVSFARAQDPIQAFPQNYQRIFKNERLEVIRVHYGPHEKIGIHDHPATPTVYVYVNDSGPVRFEHVEDHAFAITRPPSTKGSFRVSPGRIERHRVENLSDLPSDFLRIELKEFTLGKLKPLKQAAPANATGDLQETEYQARNLQIDRLICKASCSARASTSASLFVALTPVKLNPGGALDSGSVQWIPASDKVALSPASATPAHIVRILLPSAPR